MPLVAGLLNDVEGQAPPPGGPLHVAGLPTGAKSWRATVGGAGDGWGVAQALRLEFTLPVRRWVDLDTLVEATVAGLRDAGAAPRLDAVLATKRTGDPPGAGIEAVRPTSLDRVRAPGPELLDVAADAAPRAGDRDSKRAWRERLRDAWQGAPPIDGRVWADVSLATAGPLLTRLEVVLDALEPVLGRDPRGRDWQEFFPNDHIVDWLRVRRIERGPAVRLRMGRFATT